MIDQTELSSTAGSAPRYSPSAGRLPLKTNIPTESTRGMPFLSNGRGPKVQNIADGERLASLAAGSLLAALGVKRRTVPGLMMAAAGTALAFRGTTGHCALYEAFGVDTAHRSKTEQEGFIEVSQSFCINASPEKLYSFWRNLEQLPRVLTHIESIKQIDSTRSHWVAKPVAALEKVVEWDAEIVHDEPNRMIAWRSLPSSSVQTNGEIRFTKALGDRGTAVKVSMHYRPPGGRAAHFLGKMFGKSPKSLIREDLRNLKRFIELGEIPTTQGQTHGQCAGRSSR